MKTIIRSDLCKPARRLAAFAVAGVIAAVSLRAQSQTNEISGLVPKPVSAEWKQGGFPLGPATRVLASPGGEAEAESLAHRLDSLTGFSLGTGRYDGHAAGPAIILELQPALGAKLGAEGYELSVRADKIEIKASTTAGLFYGGITLSQLAFPGVQNSPSGVTVPCVEITDYPRFAWRGMMLDCSRHFQSKEFIERFLDLMAMQKMNRFHWHLVDSEGWRLEIKKYPKLTQATDGFPQSYPGEDAADAGRHGYNYGHLHGGGYYSQEDVKEIVAYAAARHIEIMPEIEFPGHSMAALIAYPEFSTTGQTPVVTSNISPDLYNVDEKSMGFLRDVLTEVMDLFPGKFIHFGGDEAPKKQWKESPAVQAKMKELGLTSENALQTWMFEQMAEFIAKKGRRAVGWDEIVAGGIPKGAVVMPWINMNHGFQAANNGNDIIIARQIPDYFTSAETDSPLEPYHIFWGVTLSAVYNQTFEYPQITPENQNHILGAQAELWGERQCHPANVEYMAFPRSAALAEALWTPPTQKDFADFSRRLAVMAKRWDRFEPPVNYHYLTPAPFAQWTPETLAANTGTTEFPITAPEDLRTVSSGSCGAMFEYGKGEGLAIHKAELVADGRVIATGAPIGPNIYRFCFAPPADFAKAAKVALRADATGSGKDSSGDIALIGGKVLDQYKPTNYPLGTVPLGYWQGADLKAGAPITVDLTGAVRKPGGYRVELRNTGGKDAITVKKIAVIQNGVERESAGVVNVQCGPGKGSVYLTIPVENIDPSAKLELQIVAETNGADTQGEIWLARMVTLAVDPSFKPDGGAGSILAKWSPETLEGEGFVVAQIDLMPGIISRPGAYHLEFRYTGGPNAADFKDVELLANAAVVAADAHEGDSGNATHNNQYVLKLDSAAPTSPKYTIQFQIKGKGGSDSNGAIRLGIPDPKPTGN